MIPSGTVTFLFTDIEGSTRLWAADHPEKLAELIELFDEEVENIYLFDPLTGAVESDAATLPEIIQEMLLTRTSERQGRAIDHDSAGSMEKKKQEGYF